MKRKIIQLLKNIEKEYCIKIVLACESGSRAWGFPSNDSDYDVRFIYVNKPDWYLTIGKKRDVIELPVDDVLDINGWDLRKTLQLMRKSNSPLLEWLSSPIQYHLLRSPYESLLSLSKTAFMTETSSHHYLSMAKRSVEKFNSAKQVRIKTYMYAIRPVLCGQWIRKHMSQPPMHISDLLSEVADNKPFKEKVQSLIETKKRYPEQYTVERSEIIEDYINQTIDELQHDMPSNSRKPALSVFDSAFKKILTEIRID